jgi:hypothetical protein
MLSVVILSVVMLNVVAPLKILQVLETNTIAFLKGFYEEKSKFRNSDFLCKIFQNLRL